MLIDYKIKKYCGLKILKALLDQNIKVLKNKIAAANQNNNLYFY